MIGSTAIVAGAMIGIRHALETDHLAAIATLVNDDTKRPTFVGASWGIGHSLPIAALGLLFVGLGIQLPASITRVFEVVVGVVLVALGARMLWTLFVGVHSHDHGHGPHRHVEVGRFSFGFTHQHVDDESFFVGMLHGFAGSGALVIALVSSAPTVTAAVSFLVAFSLLSVLTMAVVSTIWGRTLDTAFATYLKGAAGLFGIAIGATLLLEQLVHSGLL